MGQLTHPPHRDRRLVENILANGLGLAWIASAGAVRENGHDGIGCGLVANVGCSQPFLNVLAGSWCRLGRCGIVRFPNFATRVLIPTISAPLPLRTGVLECNGSSARLLYRNDGTDGSSTCSNEKTPPAATHNGRGDDEAEGVAPHV
jgi:hypothetical protein